MLDSFAGVRVLPSGNQSPFSRARESVLVHSGRCAPIYSICGGKLTTYRHTASLVVQALQLTLGYRADRLDTAQLPLN